MIIAVLIITGLGWLLAWFMDYTKKTPREKWRKRDCIIPIISVALAILSMIFLFVIHPIVGLLLLIPTIIISLVNKLFK